MKKIILLIFIGVITVTSASSYEELKQKKLEKEKERKEAQKLENYKKQKLRDFKKHSNKNSMVQTSNVLRHKKCIERAKSEKEVDRCFGVISF
jgi:hypothetical protein